MNLVNEDVVVEVQKTSVALEQFAQSNTKRKLSMCFGNSCHDAEPVADAKSFDDIVELFKSVDASRGTLNLAEYLKLDKNIPAEKEVRGLEKDGRYFIPATFARTGTRKSVDVLSVSCFVIDIDTGKISRSQIEAKLSGIKFVAYSSYSHEPTNPRWRVVIPYAREIHPSEHLNVYQHFQNLFNGNLDVRCKTTNQIWYTPACPPDAKKYFEFFVGDGDMFDVDLLPKLLTQVVVAGCNLPVITAQHYSEREIEKVKSALEVLPSDDYDCWIRIGMALNNSLGYRGFELWNDWSKKSAKFDCASSLKTWSGFNSKHVGNRLSLGTLFHEAKNYGWVDVLTETPSHIESMNEKHFVAFDGGKTFVFIEQADPITQLPITVPYGFNAFKEYYGNQKVDIQTENGTLKVNLAKHWLEHSKRRTYRGVVFNPKNTLLDNYYNLWRGFAYQPIEGDWSKYKEHMLKVICNGNVDDYDYLMNWMAFAVQHPDKPAEVAVVLKGERGTGKGTFISTFMELFGQHGLQVTNSKHLVGNFNSHLRKCIFLFADEGFFAGDKQGEATLKGLITERKIMIERKGVDAFESPSYLHIMMASNSSWVVPAGEYERRFFVLDVGNHYRQDHSYFADIKSEMYEKGGLEAMMFDLLSRDLSEFNIRNVRRTKALDEQILHSLSRENQWWLDKLMEVKPDGAWMRQEKKELQEDFCKSTSTNFDKGTITKLGMFLKKVLPDGYPSSVDVKSFASGTSKIPCYEFPSQDVCRRHYMKKLGLNEEPWGSV